MWYSVAYGVSTMEVKTDNPEMVETKTVDGQGRLYLGRHLAGEDVRVVVERMDRADAEEEA